MLKRCLFILILLAGLCALALAGCGKKSDQGVNLDASNKHPAGWYLNHRTVYRSYAVQCRECHGDVTDIAGGVVKISCTSTSYNGLTCHFQGHAPRDLPHAVPFRAASLHGTEAKKDLSFCQQCHAERLSDGTVRFDMPIGQLPHGCEECHKAGTAHPPVDKISGYGTGWTGHYAVGSITACTSCHGSTFQGGSGPACKTCHVRLPSGTGPTPGSGSNCGSCHNTPPDGDLSDTFPNIGGGHAKHVALPEIAGLCGHCHDGAGSGTANHAKSGAATVKFLSVLNSESGGNAGYDPASMTCINVVCHGGQRTPNWRTGDFNPYLTGADERCRLCHAYKLQAGGLPQYNDFGSGQHAVHVRDLVAGARVGLDCTGCHDVDKLKLKHYIGLKTSTFDNSPANTLRADLHYTPDPAPTGAVSASTGSCFPVNTGTNFGGILGCHDLKRW